jgi:hypothetical protein
MFLSCHHPSNYLSILQYSSLFFWLSLSLCLSVSLSLSIYMSVFLSSWLPACLPVCLRLSVSLSLCRLSPEVVVHQCRSISFNFIQFHSISFIVSINILDDSIYDGLFTVMILENTLFISGKVSGHLGSSRFVFEFFRVVVSRYFESSLSVYSLCLSLSLSLSVLYFSLCLSTSVYILSMVIKLLHVKWTKTPDQL